MFPQVLGTLAGIVGILGSLAAIGQFFIMWGPLPKPDWFPKWPLQAGRGTPYIISGAFALVGLGFIVFKVLSYLQVPPTTVPTLTFSATAVAPTSALSPTMRTELLSSPWEFHGSNDQITRIRTLPPMVLQGKDRLRLTCNLHGYDLHGGKANIVFDQAPMNPNLRREISLANYVVNGLDGQQSVDIPLSDFRGTDPSVVLNPNAPVNNIHGEFQYVGKFAVDIISIIAYANPF
jgi:hypothetical protein